MTTQKIAIPTDDGETISRHFGSSQYFQVVTLIDGQEPQTELRKKPGHGPKHEHAHNHDHGHDHGNHKGHGGKFALLQDCAVLIGAGMGQPAYDRLQQMGLHVILTGEKQIGAALAKFQNGELSSDMRRVHAPHHHDNAQSSVTFFDE